MTLRAAFATCAITPALGCSLSGYGGRKELASSVDDPLRAHVLVLKGMPDSCALVCADLEDVDAAFVGDVRSRIARDRWHPHAVNR